MFAFIIKLAATIILSLLAAKSAAKSKKDVSAGKKKFDRGAFYTIIALGGASGIIAMILPPGWMIQAIFIITYIVLQLVNIEGKYRATCWGLLSLLSGILLVLGMATWQDEIGGIRPWMVGIGFAFSMVPILIGVLKSVRLEYFTKKEGDDVASEKIVELTKQYKKSIVATVFTALCVVSLLTAVLWLAS